MQLHQFAWRVSQTCTVRASGVDLIPPVSLMSGPREQLNLKGGSTGEPVVFGIVTVSDRATAGVYDDASGPAILGFFHEAIKSKYARSVC